MLDFFCPERVLSHHYNVSRNVMLLQTYSSLVFLQNAMLVKASVLNTETSLAPFCDENDEAKNLFAMWVACGRPNVDMSTIRNRYHPSEVQAVADGAVFVTGKTLMLFDGQNFCQLSEQQLASDNSMLLYFD